MKVRMMADLRVMPIFYEEFEGSNFEARKWVDAKREEMLEYLWLLSDNITYAPFPGTKSELFLSGKGYVSFHYYYEEES